VDKVVSLASPVFIAKESGIAALPPREECGGLFAPKGRRHMKDVPAICNLTYHCLPVGCVYELLDVIEAVKRQLPEVKVPLLVMQGERDHTVQIKSARYIYERAGTERKSLIWLKDSGHLIPLDADREEAFRDITLFLQDKL
jgi:carboxylesterase